MSPPFLSCLRWWLTAGEDISTAAEMFMTHSSQWQSSQKMRIRLGSSMSLKTSDTVCSSTVEGMCSQTCSTLPPWSCGRAGYAKLIPPD